MLSSDLRNAFLEFFAQRGHRRVSSSSLVPRDDPSLLFTNAGMVQFKRVFTGEEKRDYRRATTAQKCVRAGGKHNDLENVGYTARHHTFFEMMGNFSFGDYFKKEAVAFAWELLTEVFRLPAEKLYATVYQDDDEAYALWEKEVGVPTARIVRLGEKDNFWAMGDTGPCGPCSEILIDQGPSLGCGKPDCGPGCDCDRYLEIWNLVFMQFERDKEGRLAPLPRPSIDTGLGLERLAAVTQGVISNFESDCFRPLLERIADLAGTPYLYGKLLSPGDASFQSNVSLRVIADHARAVVFLAGDGVRPDNLGRGYVLRRILRRAVRHGRKLGLAKPFMADMCDAVIAGVAEAYPELKDAQNYVKSMVTQEEERFRETLEGGLKILAEEIREGQAQGRTVLSGALLFKLYDTFGFPVDLVADMARESGFTVDEPGFATAMEEQKAKGRAAWKGGAEDKGALLSLVNGLTSQGFSSRFLGYETLETRAVPRLMIRDGQLASAAEAGEELTLVFPQTPFYASSGGQETDGGEIIFPQGRFTVEEVTKSPGGAVFLHRGRVSEGTVTETEARLVVDGEKRRRIANNHSATHLLHKALRETLGDHVRQAGSSVTAERLRFDFTHHAPLAESEIARVEFLVNRDVQSDFPVETAKMPIDEAIRSGAVALFEERYGEEARVVTMGDSRELCGGTHAARTGQIGLFLVASESAVASGARRIECLTGQEALAKIQKDRAILSALSAKLKAGPQDLLERVQKLAQKSKELEKAGASAPVLSLDPHQLARDAEKIGDFTLLAASAPASSPKELRDLGDRLRDILGPWSVIALAAVVDGKALLLAMAGAEARTRVKAGELIAQMAQAVGGKGGGRPDLAQAGGPLTDRIPAALDLAKDIVSNATRG
ncbi:MAG: alanine--tRNA ligase [Deltaproteobacteria bacterium]|jgi:alanyl-tRNA synthetase|nr:alanine--tRNA ligase [Deltaproteobacteria bacterium]